ncbi:MULTISPECIES: hypothetical protein [Exiguobacterium]|uniref:hypothetical protein n=1 Tax=Exiguobacterium TaxID=33986 RepID=UPI00047928DC|nr:MULTISPECIES: hypothetical protein [Exiguobacterium]MDX1259316.1 hypothetical protein [Exiguobacterium sp. K1]QNR21999.1 hypothetical protein HNY42_13970 [Exiguobacterium sp. Helios]RDB33250.1 hypothetical protein DVG79_00880 [Exiguobacterium sp. RIT594]HCN57320.1 hypothetical protein [Exiguobacterium sp.]
MPKREDKKRKVVKPFYRSDGSYDQFIEPDVESESWEEAERPISDLPDAYEEEKYRRESL